LQFDAQAARLGLSHAQLLREAIAIGIGRGERFGQTLDLGVGAVELLEQSPIRFAEFADACDVHAVTFDSHSRIDVSDF
jgi:hypothetical protein